MEDYEVEYRCGHCSEDVTSRCRTGVERKGKGTYSITPPNLLSCPKCNKDSVQYTDSKEVRPLPLLGDAVRHLKGNVGVMYTEARITFSGCAYTACVLTCRNILAYAANELGSGKRRSYQEYVDYMFEKGHITRAMKELADDIRMEGNSAAHDLKLWDEEKAWKALDMTKHVLELIFTVKGEHKDGTYKSRSYTVVRGIRFGEFPEIEQGPDRTRD